LGEDELIDIIDKEGEAEAICEFCGKVYKASQSELENLIQELQLEHAER